MFGEIAERDVRLAADPMSPLENARSFAGFDVCCLSLERRLRGRAVVASVQPNSILPGVLTAPAVALAAFAWDPTVRALSRRSLARDG